MLKWLFLTNKDDRLAKSMLLRDYLLLLENEAMQSNVQIYRDSIFVSLFFRSSQSCEAF